MIDSFEKVKTHALLAYYKGTEDKSQAFKHLDDKQKAVLALFQKKNSITAKDVETFFSLHPRTARALCLKWVNEGFFVIKDSAKKNRTYVLAHDLAKKLFD